MTTHGQQALTALVPGYETGPRRVDPLLDGPCFAVIGLFPLLLVDRGQHVHVFDRLQVALLMLNDLAFGPEGKVLLELSILLSP